MDAIISIMADVSVVVGWWEAAPGTVLAEVDAVPAEGPGDVLGELTSTPTLGERDRRFFAAGPSTALVDDFGLALVHVDALPFTSAVDFRAVFGLPLPDMFLYCGSNCKAVSGN